jgi:hypothetical protein
MNAEKIFNRPDGTRIKVLVRLYIDSYNGKVNYNLWVQKCEKGKRTWIDVADQNSHIFRLMPMEKRRESILLDYLKFATVEEINEVKEMVWQSVKYNSNPLIQ